MEIHHPQPLPLELKLSCYACGSQIAAYLCKYNLGELAIQVCLCNDCIKLDTKDLLENTVGIQPYADASAASH